MGEVGELLYGQKLLHVVPFCLVALHLPSCGAPQWRAYNECITMWSFGLFENVHYGSSLTNDNHSEGESTRGEHREAT